jgi:putative membrane-bound dehydrogenase-like protein
MSCFASWITAALTLWLPGPAPSPRSLDSRLVFERIATEPVIVTPTGLTIDSRGRLLVIESHTHFRPKSYKGPPSDRIRLFEDADGDGRYERVSTFFEGTKHTMNLAFARDGTLFLATRSAVYRLEDRDGDGRADGEAASKVPAPIVRLDTPGDYPHNGLSGFAFDLAGNVYFGLGENLGADYRLIGSDGRTLAGGGEGGSIYRCRPEGSNLERIATGFWNPWHLAFDAFGRLFAVDNDPDSRPPCRLLHIVQGGDYGYRFRNGRKGLHPFTAWNGELPGTLPMVAGTGEAPCGVLAYEADNLPADYRGRLLVTSWGDHRIERYRLQPRGASFHAEMEPIVTGGEDFRPVGIALSPDGSIFFTDWVDKSYDLHGKGRIWRLRGRTPGRVPRSTTLEKNLTHPRQDVREFAARVLTHPEVDGLATLTRAITTNPDPRARAAALQAMAAAGRVDAALAARIFKERLPDVQSLAVRSLPESLIDLDAVATANKSPLVRAEALRRLANPDAKRALLTGLESDDPFVQQAARAGLKRSLKYPEVVELVADFNAAHRLGALLILRETAPADARTQLARLLADPDPSVRVAAIQWVGEERLSEFRSQLLSGLSLPTTTREAFEGTLAALEFLDAKKRNPDPRDEVPGEEYVATLLKDPKTSATVVRRGLRLLRPNHPVLTLDLLKRFVSSADDSVRLEAVRTLGESTVSGRIDILGKIAADSTASLPLRVWAVIGLAADTSHQKGRLLTIAESGPAALRREAIRALRIPALSGEERERLEKAAHDDEYSLAILRHPGSSETETPGNNGTSGDHGRPSNSDLDAWMRQLQGPADAGSGERIFYHPRGPACYRCHEINGRGGRSGPDLSRLAKGMDKRRLVQSNLQPSLEIAPQFVAWSVARTDGTVFTGVLLGETPEGALRFADSEGHTINVKKDEIEERKLQPVSIMPDDVGATLTLQEFRDLIAFLLEKRSGS